MPYEIIETKGGSLVSELARRWRLVLLAYNPTRAIGAADWTGICDALIEGYADIDDHDAVGLAAARIRFAVARQKEIQASLHPAALLDLPPSARAALASEGHDQPEIAEWSSDLPLVLVDYGYEPFSTVPRPVDAAQSIVWIEAADEESLIRSLVSAGWLDLLCDGELLAAAS